MLKTLHTLVAGHGEIEMGQSWKHPSYWLDFVLLGGAIQAGEGGLLPMDVA